MTSHNPCEVSYPQLCFVASRTFSLLDQIDFLLGLSFHHLVPPLRVWHSHGHTVGTLQIYIELILHQRGCSPLSPCLCTIASFISPHLSTVFLPPETWKDKQEWLNCGRRRKLSPFLILSLKSGGIVIALWPQHSVILF